MSHIKQRLALWALGQALPKASVFQSHIREALIGVVLATAGGVLIALSFASALFLLHRVMIEQGVTQIVAISFITAFSLLLATCAFLGARRMIRKATTLTDDLQLFENSPPTSDTIGEAVKSIVSGFVAGFLEEPATPTQHSLVKDVEDELEKIKEELEFAVERVSPIPVSVAH